MRPSGIRSSLSQAGGFQSPTPRIRSVNQLTDFWSSPYSSSRRPLAHTAVVVNQFCTPMRLPFRSAGERIPARLLM